MAMVDANIVRKHLADGEKAYFYAIRKDAYLSEAFRLAANRLAGRKYRADAALYPARYEFPRLALMQPNGGRNAPMQVIQRRESRTQIRSFGLLSSGLSRPRNGRVHGRHVAAVHRVGDIQAGQTMRISCPDVGVVFALLIDESWSVVPPEAQRTPGRGGAG
jgi:hypothetical protein